MTSVIIHSDREAISLAAREARNWSLYLNRGEFYHMYNDLVDGRDHLYNVKHLALAYRDQRPVATGFVWTYRSINPPHWMVSCFVADRYRRRGIGTEVVRALCDHSEEDVSYTGGIEGSLAFWKNKKLADLFIPKTIIRI